MYSNYITIKSIYSRGSSQPRDWTHVSCVSCIGRQILYHWATWEALKKHLLSLRSQLKDHSFLDACPHSCLSLTESMLTFFVNSLKLEHPSGPAVVLGSPDGPRSMEHVFLYVILSIWNNTHLTLSKALGSAFHKYTQESRQRIWVSPNINTSYCPNIKLCNDGLCRGQHDTHSRVGGQHSAGFSKHLQSGTKCGTPLVVQWWRICLAKQGIWVWSLVWELRSHLPWRN